MADFDEVRLELGFDFSAVGGPTINVDETVTDSGADNVNTGWDQMLGRWNVGSRKMLTAEKDYLLSFFRARHGPVRGFRFKDWADYSASAQPIGTGDGSTRAFQLVKRYVSGAVTFTRPIYKPVDGQVTVYVDAVPVAVTLFPETGIVDLNSAPALNAAITADFEFDVPVTFAQTEFKTSFKAFDLNTGEGVFYLGGLALKEVLNP